MTSKIIKNVFSSWTYYFIQLAIGFFLMPFMVHRLGAEVYGLWILVFSFAAYVSFFDFGIRGSVVKYVAEFEAKKDFGSLNKVINTSWLIHSSIGLLIILAFFMLSNFLQYFFEINPMFLNDFRVCFRLIGLSIGLTLFFNIFVGILEGYKRNDVVSIIESATFILQSALITVIVIKGYGIVSLAIIIILVNLLKQIIRAICCFNISPHLRLNFFLFNRNTLKTIFSYSIFLFTFQGMLTILNSLPNIILGAFLGTASITFYSIAERLIGYFRTFLFTTSGTLVPFISSFDALNDTKRVKKSFLMGSKYSYSIVLFLVLILIVMGRPFINLWMGEAFTNKSYNVLVIIVIPLLFSPAFFTIQALLKGLGRLKEITICTAIQLLLSVILSIILVKKLGLNGVALAFAIPYFLNYVIVLPALMLHILGISGRDYFKAVYLKPMIPALILLLCLIFLRNNYYPSSYIVLILEILFSGLIYSIVSFKVILEDHERNFYLSKLNLCFRNT
ncbi:MAG: oligosaccharide flippase family protein [Candidatus Omnitrophica bacterium]|nr:oligosaccharide flippase family protein [Candidatus Omnitrophota bacterium]